MTNEKIDKIKTWLPIVISLLTLVAGGGWFGQYLKSKEDKEQAYKRVVEGENQENQRLLREYLYPISTSLKDNKEIKKELDDNYLEQGYGVLESYLIKIRRNTVKSNSLMRQHINTIVDNNNKITTLLTGYQPYIITNKFKEQAEMFRKHAIRYNDRWKAIPEIQETNEFLPISLPFPQEFTSAVQEEINTRAKKSGQ